MAARAKATRLIDNRRVIVTEWSFRPGDATGFHTHAHDYVVVPLTSGTLRIVDTDGNAGDARLVTGVPYARDAGVSHDVVNANPFTFRFIEIELK
ncbi:MAG TPA: cupin domain-containing protein [Candidatus Binataceae bacterium]|jgi:quercetin dioxygenase-like cupin family protein|nr:cupin domain-containing protein [Candidatus Binataceae bacterium]